MSHLRKDPIPNQDSKLLAMSPPRKDLILNKDSNRIITQQDTILPPLLAKYPTVYKPLFNGKHDPNSTEDEPNDSTDNSRNESGDSVNKLKVKNNEDNYDEYKDENPQLLKKMKVLSKTEKE